MFESLMRFLRSTIAVWLLVTFGACYAFPVTITMSARAAKCCHRGGHGSCCRKSENTAGSFWTAAADCAQACRLPAGLTVHASPLVAPDSAESHTTVRSETLVLRNTHPAGFSSYFAFLYQRPPPVRF
jgi:hypothetical protein